MENQDWVYSDKVKDHFLNPRNFLMGDESQFNYDAVGQVGNPVCGDQMRMYIKVKNGKITDLDIDEALEKERVFDMELYKIAMTISI